MMIALDRTLRVISETKLQTRVIKEVRNLLSSKLPSMMVDCVVPKTKRVSKGLDLGVKESDKKIAITELPLMTSTHANEWYEFDAKAYFDTKSNGRGAVVVIAEDSKNMKTYICTNDKSKCLVYNNTTFIHLIHLHTHIHLFAHPLIFIKKRTFLSHTK